jgi:hypothetical protein
LGWAAGGLSRKNILGGIAGINNGPSAKEMKDVNGNVFF